MAATTPRAPVSAHDGAAPHEGVDGVRRRADWRDQRYQAFALMRLTFTIAPIAAALTLARLASTYDAPLHFRRR